MMVLIHKYLHKKLLCLFFLFIVFLVITPSVLACGPFFKNYIYMPEDLDGYYPYQNHENLFNSNTGMIMSKWGPEYLYPIYMDLIGKKLSPEIETAMKPYLSDYNYYGTVAQDADESWTSARSTVIDGILKVNPNAEFLDSYSYIVNCTPNAFLTAKQALEERSKIYSKDQLTQWIKRQDDVFANCSKGYETDKITTVPTIGDYFSEYTEIVRGWFKKDVQTLPNKDIPPEQLLAYDQEYQKAAIEFYKGNFSDAEKLFTAISENPDQPWRGYSALVIARIYIRKGEFTPFVSSSDSDSAKQIADSEKIRDYWFRKAMRQLTYILDSKSLSSIHEGASDLVNFINFRINPHKRLLTADSALMNPSSPENVISNIEDLSQFWVQKVLKKEKDETEKAEYSRLVEWILKDGGDFTQWLYVWQSGEAKNFAFAVDKYNKQKTLPWLLVSGKLLNADSKYKDQILADLAKIPQESVGYFTANYYRVKYLISTGKTNESIEIIDSILNSETIAGLPIVKNYFSQLRMQLADSLSSTYKYALRELIDSNFGSYYSDYMDVDKPVESITMLDKKIVNMINQELPLNKWVEIVSDTSLFTPQIRKQIGLTAFVRAVLLENWNSAKKIAEILSSGDDSLRRDFQSFLATANAEEMKFASTLFLLQYSGIGTYLDYRFEDTLGGDFDIRNLDDYRRNWWCSKQGTESNNWPWMDIKSENKLSTNKLISSGDIAQADTENKLINSFVAPNYLASEVMRYASKNQSDPRVPKALHDVVTATKISYCSDKETTNYSKEAFQLLNNLYPGSYWANQTPYWY